MNEVQAPRPLPSSQAEDQQPGLFKTSSQSADGYAIPGMVYFCEPAGHLVAHINVCTRAV